MPTPHDSLSFQRGPGMANRFGLAPLTNRQSHDDGTLSDEEYAWLVKRAEGGFGLTMSCAASVHPGGRSWAGQLGVHDDTLLPGMKRLAEGIRAQGSLAIVQIHHGGCRAPSELIGGQAPVAPSAHDVTGARALELEEIHMLREAFIRAAERCEEAGWDGVELHGAHGYLLCQFLSPEYNRREDAYGGSPENRERLLHEIIAGIRERCGRGFCLGVRLSPEGLGLVFGEMLDLARRLLAEERIDFLDMSLWDSFKFPEDEERKEKRLLDWYAGLPRDKVRLAVAGKIHSAEHVRQVLEAGVDFVLLGRAGILHHDFPRQVEENTDFVIRDLPVSREVLRREGLSDKFIGYMGRWPGFVEDGEE